MKSRFAALLIVFGLIVAACGESSDTDAAGGGSSETTAASEPTPTETTATAEEPMEDMDDDAEGHDHNDDDAEGHDHDEEGDGEHDHGSAVEASGDMTVAIDVTEDTLGGYNVLIDTSGFAFSAENASSDHVDGEGHAHIYVDGTKVGRVYGNAHHLSSLEPGSHDVMVELNANDHRPYTVGGLAVMSTQTIDVPEATTAALEVSEETATFEGEIGLGVSVLEDAVGGWNLLVSTDGFTFTPESVGGDHVNGEGYGLLYVNDVPTARIYGNYFHIGSLEPGDNALSVNLITNDHRPYWFAGGELHATAIAAVPGEVAFEGTVIEVTVNADGSIEGESRHAVAIGDTVLIRVTGETADEVHVHGYDLFADLAPGQPAEVTFVADVPGIFEVELEGAGVELVKLEVS